jgi:alpha-galactosidase
MEDGSKAVGLFNGGAKAATVTARWRDLGLTEARRVRDLWRQQDLAITGDPLSAEVPRHGCALLRIWGKAR